MKTCAIALIAGAIVMGTTPAAWALVPSEPTPNGTGAAPISTGPHYTHEVAGIRIVPSILARDVNLTPSAWVVRTAGNHAFARARLYTDQQGALIGMSLTAVGLPNPETIHANDHTYVVWLYEPATNKMLNLGALDAHNGGPAVFGYTASVPITGYSRVVITPEPSAGSDWPSSWAQLHGDLPQVALAPVDGPTVHDEMTLPER